MKNLTDDSRRSSKLNVRFREDFGGVVMIELLQDLIRQRDSPERRLLVRREIRVGDWHRANVGGFPQFSMRPPAAGEEVEAAVVAADLIRAEENSVLVADEEFASLVPP